MQVYSHERAVGCQLDLWRRPPLSPSGLASLPPGLLVQTLQEVSLGRMRPRPARAGRSVSQGGGGPRRALLGPGPALGKYTGLGKARPAACQDLSPSRGCESWCARRCAQQLDLPLWSVSD